MMPQATASAAIANMLRMRIVSTFMALSIAVDAGRPAADSKHGLCHGVVAGAGATTKEARSVIWFTFPHPLRRGKPRRYQGNSAPS